MLPLLVVGGIGIPYNAVLASDISVSRDLPGPSTVKPGITFEVTITFTAPQDNFNAIVIHDEVPAGWQVVVDKGACLPPPLTAKTVGSSEIEYSWLGPFDAGQTFRAVYEVIVPSEATGGTHALHDGWLVYYIEQDEYQSSITGDSSVEVRINNQSAGGDDIPTNTTTSESPANNPTSPVATGKSDNQPVITVEKTEKEGESHKSISVKSQDERIKLTLAEGTIGLTEKNLPVTEISVNELLEPPGYPREAIIVGPIYNLSPEGATFKPALNLSMIYDAADIPLDSAEEKLVIAYWNTKTSEWINLDSAVHKDTKTVTASVTHFTVFSILAHKESTPTPIFSVKNITVSPDIAETGEQVTIFALVLNNSGNEHSYEINLAINGVIEKSQVATFAAKEIKIVSFTTSRDTAGSYTINIGGLKATLNIKAKPVSVQLSATTTKPKSFDQSVVFAIVGGLVVIIGITILIVLKRRRD